MKKSWYKSPIYLFVVLFALELNPLFAQTNDRLDRMESSEFEKPASLLVLSCVEYDFGTIDRRGGDVSCTIRFRNEGTNPLVLTRVITSCSCLKADFSKRPIPAGAEGELHLTYQPLKAAPGTFYKVVQILSNSRDGRQIITIHGKSVDHTQF